jgi:hypothetical protein
MEDIFGQAIWVAALFAFGGLILIVYLAIYKIGAVFLGRPVDVDYVYFLVGAFVGMLFLPSSDHPTAGSRVLLVVALAAGAFSGGLIGLGIQLYSSRKSSSKSTSTHSEKTATEHHSGLRAGNGALSYLVTKYSPMDAKLQNLADSLPKIADELYRDAEDAARTLLRCHTPNALVRVARGIAAAIFGMSSKERALANSIFDLQLTVCFKELMTYVGDNDIASLLVDALLYQATGFEASSCNEEDLLLRGTHNMRGIHKYHVARKSRQDMADVEAWEFGKEFSAIVSGRPWDGATIVSVAPFSLGTRVQARWVMRYLLYGTPPTEEDEQALTAVLKEQEKTLQDMTDKLTRLREGKSEASSR